MSTSQAPDLSPEYIAAYTGYKTIIVTVIFICLETLCVALRVLARHLSNAHVGLDDILIIPSWLISMATCAIILGRFDQQLISLFSSFTSSNVSLAMVHYGGVGRHASAIAETDPSVLTVFAKLEVAFVFLYLVAVTLPKLVILSLYLRLFPQQGYRKASYALCAVLVASYLADTVAAALICRPLSALWNPNIVGSHCINQNAFFRWATFPNILTDICLLILPIPTVWNTKLSVKTKIGLTLTLGTGSMYVSTPRIERYIRREIRLIIPSTCSGLITSILRFAAFTKTDDVTDATWSSVKLAIYGITETGVYLIAACLPTYRIILVTVQRHASLSLSKVSLTRRATTTEPSKDASLPLDYVQTSKQRSKYGNLVVAEHDSATGDDTNLVESASFYDPLSTSERGSAPTWGSSDGVTGIKVEHGVTITRGF